MENLKLISGVETVEIEKTMTSLELVDLINKVRKEEFERGRTKQFTRLQHKDFLRKVPNVLGRDASAKFYAVAKANLNNGGSKNIPCYKFPERESWLMAMSYSYSLQALVYDTLQEVFKCNHEFRPLVDKITELERRVELNGSSWGKMGNEQKKNRRIIDRIADSLCDIAQLKLFDIKQAQ